MTFEDFAFACDCNATSLVAHEHALDCTAVRCWYKVDDAMASLKNRLDAFTELALVNERRAERYQEALEVITENIRLNLDPRVLGTGCSEMYWRGLLKLIGDKARAALGEKQE